MVRTDESIDPLDSLETVETAPDLGVNQPHSGHNSGSREAQEGSGNDQLSSDINSKNDIKTPESTAGAKPYWKVQLDFWFTVFKVYIMLMVIFMGVLSVYWGAFYKRDTRYKDMTSLLVNLDLSVDANGTEVQGFGSLFENMIKDDPWVKDNFGFDIMPMEEALSYDNITEKAVELVHHEKYWGVFIIGNNISNTLYEALQSQDAEVAQEIPTFINAIYQQTRSLAAFNSYYLKNFQSLEEIWVNNYAYLPYSQFLTSLPSEQQIDIVRNNDTIKLLTVKPTFNAVDISVTVVSAALGPSMLGLIYAQLFTIYQFSFFQKSYTMVQKQLSLKSYVFFRVVATHVNSLVLGLVYSLATIAFQVPVTNTFGHSGFLVLWMFMYLFICANGFLSETVLGFATSFNTPWLIAPYTLLSVVFNVVTAYYPFDVSPGFYRIGYGLPMYNVFQLVKVVFFDTYKGHMGGEIGVLLAWIVVGTCTSIAVLVLIKRKDDKALAEGKPTSGSAF